MTVNPSRDADSNFQTAGNTAAVRASEVTVRVEFKDLDDVVADPANPSFRITDPETGENVSVEALGIVQNQDGSYTPEKISTGLFSITFLTTGLDECIYQVEWNGEYADKVDPTRIHTRVIKGSLGIGQISRTQDFINRITFRLMDDHPEEYRIDEPVKWWRPSQLFHYLRDAVARFNAIGPRRTTCTIETFNVEVDELLVTGGVIWALRARARLEIANTMQYTDGHTLNINRGPPLMQLADTLYREWLEAVKDFKKSTPPTPIGIRSQRVPFRIFRVIGLLPNYKSFFSA